MSTPFNPFALSPLATPDASPPSTVSNLEHRLAMAIKAAQQAQSDLDLARYRAGLPPVAPAFAVRDVVPSDPAALAAAIVAAGERARSGK